MNICLFSHILSDTLLYLFVASIRIMLPYPIGPINQTRHHLLPPLAEVKADIENTRVWQKWSVETNNTSWWIGSIKSVCWNGNLWRGSLLTPTHNQHNTWWFDTPFVTLAVEWILIPDSESAINCQLFSTHLFGRIKAF